MNRFRHFSNKELDFITRGIQVVYPGNSFNQWQAVLKEAQSELASRNQVRQAGLVQLGAKTGVKNE